ncbi:hypothetical protein [Brevibacterium samyangense]|uniref:Uncharacterized protein n=1 Tax=Brevibacterium samyangense TaxID=366888 RepID=A0ABN2TJJ0_9MICO
MWGDEAGPAPETAAEAVLAAADAGATAEVPHRVVIGSASYDMLLDLEAARLERLRTQEAVSRLAPG